MDKIRILIVDDQTLIREGLGALLALVPDLLVVGQAADGQAALDLVAAYTPDIVLMDVRMPGMNGVAATREIRQHFPATRVIVLTTFDNDEYLMQSLHAGESILDPAVMQKIIQCAVRAEPMPRLSEKLTPREREVLRLLVASESNTEIAERLCLSEGTVKNHVSHILDKLGARDRAHAIHLAVQWNLAND
ncbi:MAG: response regulator transcription factor [Chloroflexi bacterium]|nr:response regulator transcription factor [Chloroflexota bacterium]